MRLLSGKDVGGFDSDFASILFLRTHPLLIYLPLDLIGPQAVRATTGSLIAGRGNPMEIVCPSGLPPTASSWKVTE